jgi:hypothetical protein
MAGYSKNVISRILVDNAARAISASYALTASYAMNGGGGTTTGSFTGSFTGSLFGTASYALSASYALNSPGTPGGTNTQIQFNSASVFSGSSKLTYNYVTSSLILTGSLNITGSTTQVGNNILLGNTLLSGSIIISGSQSPGSPTASVQIYGDIRQSGYHRFDPVTTNIDTTVSASYIYVSGSTNDLYFSQNGLGYNNVTRLRWLEGNLYTGLLHGGLITSQSSTTYQVGSGSGIIVTLNTSIGDDPYPTVQFLEWGNLTNTITALSSSFDQQFVAIDSTNNILAQGTPYNNGDYNIYIPIGIVLHQNRSTINGVQTFPGVAYGWKQRSFDFIKAFGGLKISGYTLAQSGSSTRGLLLSGGTAWVDGRNYTIDPNQPSYITEAVGTPTSKIFRYYQSGSNWQSHWGYNTNGGAGFTDINPTQYSNAGTLTSVGSNKWSIQRVFYFPNSATKALFVYYGNAEYDNEADALAAVSTETFTEAPNTAASAIYVGYMLLRNDANFTVPASFTFYQAGLFRGSGGSGGGGGGGGATTLAGLTDVSLSGNTPGDLLVYGTSNLWNNSKQLTGSYGLTGSLTITQNVSASSFTGSLFGTSSYITGSIFTSTNPALSSSYSVTASYAESAVTASTLLPVRAGVINSTVWQVNNNIYTASVNITPPFPPGRNDYSVAFTAISDLRFFGLVTASRASGSFRVSANSSVPITNLVTWVAVLYSGSI